MLKYGSYRFTRAEVNLDRLVYNYKTFKNILKPETKFMGVVKADAYGHGAVDMAKELEEQKVDYLAVAVLDEALELRNAGIKTPILLFSPIEPETLPIAIKHNIALTVFTNEVARIVVEEAVKLQKEATVHLKVDSGMSRIGVSTKNDALEVMQALHSPFVNVEGIYTHFADAENTEEPEFTHEQYNFFNEIIDFLESYNMYFALKHCCNTAASLLYPDYHLDMVRTGISLCGYHPVENMEHLLDLKPVMTLKTHAAYIKDLPAGKSISYGRSYMTSKEETIATILLGYADGVPRQLSNQGHLTIKGQKAPIVGRVCMDQLMINVTNIEQISEETEIIFFGDPKEGHPSVYDISALSVGFHYELLCGITKRIPRMYLKDNQVHSTYNPLLEMGTT